MASDTTAQSSRRRCGLWMAPDEEEELLAAVYRRSLSMVETDARRLRQKNAKALRICLEQTAREAAERAA